jgi:energy-coupling factor transporter ATP-binding protein EcfA2
VAIARALANDPPLIAADEPTGNLDSKTAEAMFKLFERLVAQGKTFLMVTHDRDLAKRVPRTIVIADGEVVSDIRNDVEGQPVTAAPAWEAASRIAGGEALPKARLPEPRAGAPRHPVPQPSLVGRAPRPATA